MQQLEQLLLSEAPDAYVLMDMQGGVVYWNRCAEQIFGYSGQEVLGQHLSDFIVPPERRAAGVTFVFLGWSIASAAGMPIGSWLGSELGWRAGYLMEMSLALAAAVAVAAAIAVTLLGRVEFARFATTYFLTELPGRLSAVDMFNVVSMAVVLTVLASLYPAWRASKFNPVELLRRG